MDKAKILILVEGAKTDVNLMSFLLEMYGISDNHEIVSYNTNIYVLYKELFEENDPESLDLLQVLKAREKDTKKKKIFDEYYSDVLLIFDLDPHDSLYSGEKIVQMLEYFNESSENGKLYLNYPMVEAFYHMRSIPDTEYCDYVASLEELIQKKYKSRVQQESRNKDYRKFILNITECNQVIIQNIEKANLITGNIKNENSTIQLFASATEIFGAQEKKMISEAQLYVLCTCVFYILDYNSRLICESNP